MIFTFPLWSPQFSIASCLSGTFQKPHFQADIFDHHVRHAQTLRNHGQHQIAELTLRHALQASQSQHYTSEHRLRIMRAHRQHAEVLVTLQQWDAAFKAYQSAIGIQQPDHIDDDAFHELLTSAHGMAMVLVKQGKITEAQRLLRDNLAILMQYLGPHHPATQMGRDALKEIIQTGNTCPASTP